MMSVSEHLSNAISELEQAIEEADVGTALMLKDPLSALRNIERRYDNINDDSTTESE